MTKPNTRLINNEIDLFGFEFHGGSRAVVSAQYSEHGNDFIHMTVPERTSVRHGTAIRLEVGSRADINDNAPHPYTNWGYKNRLEYELDTFRKCLAARK